MENQDDKTGDWPKRTWDLLTVNSPGDLHRDLELSGLTVEDFKRLPIYKKNVDKIPWLREL